MSLSSSTEHGSQPPPPPSRSQTVYNACKPIIAGAITGAIETFVTYPTEYVKTHLQLQGNAAKVKAKSMMMDGASTAAASSSTHAVAVDAHVVYNGMLDCYMKTIRARGVLGLYQGMTPVLVGAIPKQATRWGVFEFSASSLCSFKRSVLLLDEKDCHRSKLSLAEVSACGLVAGAVEACCAVVPMDTVKTRLIDDAKSATPLFTNKSLPVAVQMMVKNEGIRGVYKGVASTVMKQSVNQMVRFPAQLATMNVFCSGWLCSAEMGKRRRKSPFWNGFAGFIAGVFSVLLSQPFDVVKTRMQSQEGHRYTGSLHCFRTIVREDGAMKMYAGCVPRMMRVGGNVALTFTLFPIIKKFL